MGWARMATRLFHTSALGRYWTSYGQGCDRWVLLDKCKCYCKCEKTVSDHVVMHELKRTEPPLRVR
eukprot:154969-Amphidinium_carterae.2